MGSSRSNVSLRRAAGSVLVVGLEGARLTAVEAAWLKLIRPGGIILFRRNIEDAQQTHALLQTTGEATRDAASKPLLRCIDVEGGTVDRLRDLVAPMPSPSAVNATRNRKLFAVHGRLIGKELRVLGLNVTFAPVLDLKTATSLKVMTSRVVSGEPTEVVEYAKFFLEGLAQEGVLGCGKHFPGLGRGRVDSHHSTPRIEERFESLWKEDLLPYRQLRSQLAFVMISHGSYPLTPSGVEPASISHFWISDILKKKIGFRGLIVSDDMEMGGILSYTGLADAAIRALLAGAHLIEICRDPALVLSAYESLLTEAERSPAFARRLLEAAAMVDTFKRKHLQGDPPPSRPTLRSMDKLRAEIGRFTQQVAAMERALGQREGDRV